MVHKVLVVARHKPVEALRVAAGLTLADAELTVLAFGALPAGEQAEVQLEALAFADIVPLPVPPEESGGWADVARAIIGCDAVYVL